MFDAVCGFEVARVISSPPARLLLIFLFLCKFIFRLAQSCGCRDRAAECDAATNRCIESAASAAAQMLFSIKTAANGGREGGRGERGRRGEGNWMGLHIYLLFVELIRPSFFSLALRTEGQRTETVHLLLSFLPLSSPPSFSSVSFILSSSFLYQGQVFVSPPPVSAAHSLRSPRMNIRRSDRQQIAVAALSGVARQIAGSMLRGGSAALVRTPTFIF